MKKRVFVALPISEDIKIKIEEWKKNYRDLPVRWIKKENLHITLVPPWYVSEVDDVINRLKSVSQGKKRFWTSSPRFAGEAGQNDEGPKRFTITFREVAFGPNPKRPRLIWVSGDMPSEIITLKSKLGRILYQKSEKRDFLTHLTIARFKEKDFSKFEVKSLQDEVFWEEKVNSFMLMESRLKRSGAEYEKLAEIPLLS